MTIPDTPLAPSSARVLTIVSGIIVDILGPYGIDNGDIGMETTFHDDLALESIDLVTLASRLASEFGDEVNLAEYLADMDLDEVISLTVGDIVSYVVSIVDQP